MFDVAWFPLIVTVYGMAAIVCAIAAYIIAMNKRRDRETWAFVCFFLPPLLLLLISLRNLRPYEQAPPHIHDDDDDDDDGDQHARNLATRYPT
jgi:hypothetical protein